MQCHKCRNDTRIAETRSEGLVVYRRRVCLALRCGASFWSEESFYAETREADRMGLVEKMLRDGMNPLEVAQVCGVSKKWVGRIRSRIDRQVFEDRKRESVLPNTKGK